MAIVTDPITKPTYYSIEGIDGGMIYDATEHSWHKVEDGKITVRFIPHYDENARKYRPVAKVLIVQKESPIEKLLKLIESGM